MSSAVAAATSSATQTLPACTHSHATSATDTPAMRVQRLDSMIVGINGRKS